MGKDLTKVNVAFYPCDGGSCRKAGSENTTREMRKYLLNSGNWEITHTIRTRCNGRCEDAPTVIVQPGNYWYKNVDGTRGVELIKSHLEKNEPLTQSLLFDLEENEMRSENERSNSFIKPFEFHQLPTGNNGWMTKGLSSDQYLYPLISKLIGIQGSYEDEKGNAFDLQKLETVHFSDQHYLEMNFDSSALKLLIGPVPQTDTSNRQEEKVRGTYYFIEENEQRKGVQFRNKMGNVLGTLLFESDELWQYCLNIQLKGLTIKEKVS